MALLDDGRAVRGGRGPHRRLYRPRARQPGGAGGGQSAATIHQSEHPARPRHRGADSRAGGGRSEQQRRQAARSACRERDHDQCVGGAGPFVKRSGRKNHPCSNRKDAVMVMRSGPSSRAAGGWWLPVLIVAVSFFVLMAFETGYAIHDRDGLAEQQRLQEPAVQEAIKLRQKIEGLAGKTAQLAADGDEGAKAVVDQMKRQGIKKSPPKQ